MTDTERIIEQIREHSNYEAYIERLVVGNPDPLLAILKSVRKRVSPPRFDELRIEVYPFVSSALPFEERGGDVKRLTFSSAPGKRTFDEWNNFEGIQTVIGHFTPEGFIGVARTDADYAASKERQRQDVDRHEQRKQRATEVIAWALERLSLDRPPLQSSEAAAILKSCFSHSPDYRTAQGYSLTKSQAAVVKLLHENWVNGTPELGQEFILDQIESGQSRLADVFKKNKPAYNALICRGRGKGTFRLNIG
jgi:hypothetical protein